MVQNNLRFSKASLISPLTRPPRTAGWNSPLCSKGGRAASARHKESLLNYSSFFITLVFARKAVTRSRTCAFCSDVCLNIYWTYRTGFVPKTLASLTSGYSTGRNCFHRSQILRQLVVTAMDESGYRPDQSFANSFAAYSFDQIPLSIHALIEYLSLCLSPDDIVDLSRQLRRFSDADLYSLATSFRRRCMCCKLANRSTGCTDLQ
jgi:hypothetical protein